MSLVQIFLYIPLPFCQTLDIYYLGTINVTVGERVTQVEKEKNSHISTHSIIITVCNVLFKKKTNVIETCWFLELSNKISL